MLRQLSEILDKREKQKLVILLFGAIFMSFLGALGVAPIMPFILVAADPSAVLENEHLKPLFEVLSFVNEDNILLYMGICVITFVVLAASSALGFKWMMTRITWGIANTMALRLLQSYCYSPYEIFLTKDTKRMSFKILNEIATLAVGILNPLATLFASIFTTLFLFTLLLLADFRISLIILVSLGSTYSIIFLIFKKNVVTLGKGRVGQASDRFIAAEEILQNIKATKVFGKERFFLEKFSKASHAFTNAQSKAPLYMESPRALLETITFGGVVVVLLYIDTQGGLNQYLPKLSLFALAGYRLLPSLQQIYFSMTDIKYHIGGLEALHSDITELRMELSEVEKEASPDHRITYNREIRLHGIGFSYPKADAPLFNDLSLSIKKGQRVAFIGSTGSGKSTLVDLVMGLLTPQKGEVYIDDLKLSDSDWKTWRRRVGYVPQEIYLINDSIRKNIAFGLYDNQIPEPDLIQAARIAEISDFIETELEEGYDTNVGERGIRLSGGQKQRIGLARALYHEPDVLVLDEATSALDNKTERSIMKSIDNLPMDLTIIMVAHRLSTVKKCDVIYVMEKGIIVDHGSYDELKLRCKLFEEMKEQAQEVSS
jgi:ATP-binding cassette, subfamily B, bacterial PglK